MVTEAGRRVVQVESTRAALERLRRDGSYAVIVSDMSRVENGRRNDYAGLDLLEELRTAGFDTPVVFYSSPSGLSAVREELDRADNVGYTASPSELMRLLQVYGAV
jgi:CheY-like chemotaxis protein